MPILKTSAFLIITALLFAAPAHAQSVQIVSPADNVSVSPGQKVIIVVKGSPGIKTALITVEKPLPQAKETAPMHYVMSIPDDMPEGVYHIRAMSQLGGQFVESERIGLVVEWPDQLIKAEPYPSSITFDAIGENQPLKILGTFKGGQQLDVARSGKSAYASGDINVAAVSLDGIVTSLGIGKTDIIFRNSGVLSLIPVTVTGTHHGGITYDIHMAADTPLSRGSGDDYYVVNVSSINHGNIPLAYVKLQEARLNNQPANSLPQEKLNFVMGDKWNFKLGFTDAAGPRGGKATLHVKGVYSPVPEMYKKEIPFEADYAVVLP